MSEFICILLLFWNFYPTSLAFYKQMNLTCILLLFYAVVWSTRGVSASVYVYACLTYFVLYYFEPFIQLYM